MVVALTKGQELGLAGVAAAFIVFALLAAFVLPRRDPNFPGRRLGLFIGVTVLLVAAMMTAVVLLAREPEEEEGGHEGAPAGTVQGHAEAGEAVFASAGCGSCHALEAAGSSGAAGPDLDQAAPDHETVVHQVTNGGGGMPAFGDQLSEQEIQDVAAFVVESTSG